MKWFRSRKDRSGAVAEAAEAARRASERAEEAAKHLSRLLDERDHLLNDALATMTEKPRER